MESGKRDEVCSLDLLLLKRASDGGELEEAVVERLGTIEERFLFCWEAALRMFHQGLFWQRLKRRLEALSLRPALRREAEETAAEKIPAPVEGWALWPRQCSLGWRRRPEEVSRAFLMLSQSFSRESMRTAL